MVISYILHEKVQYEYMLVGPKQPFLLPLRGTQQILHIKVCLKSLGEHYCILWLQIQLSDESQQVMSLASIRAEDNMLRMKKIWACGVRNK